MEDLTSKANDPMRTSGVRAASVAPAKRGGAVGTPEGSHEVARISVANPPADLLHRKVSLDLQTPRLRPAPRCRHDAAYMVSRIAEQIPGRAIMEEDSRCRDGTRSSVVEDVSVRG